MARLHVVTNALDLADVLARAHAVIAELTKEQGDLLGELHTAWVALREQPSRAQRQVFVLHVRDSANEHSYEAFRTRAAAEAQALYYLNQAREGGTAPFTTFADADKWADDNNWRIVIESTRLK